MKKILIIDDDPGIRDSIRLVFNAAYYEVTIWPDGSRILTGDFEPPDIFIIDKQLPGVDGLDLCIHLKAQEATKDIPIIIMSASPLASRLAKEACAAGFIEKPFRIKQIRELVEKFMRTQDNTLSS